jgi:TM2 domain-containing membrane protein YozV
MHLHIKAALLSAFVLPGLGQFYKHDKVKGTALILLVNIFLLAGLFFVMRGMGQLLLTTKLSGTADASRIIATLKSNSPAARWLLAAFFALWAYGVVDALLSGGDKTRDDR